MNDTLIFKAIVNFATDLAEAFTDNDVVAYSQEVQGVTFAQKHKIAEHIQTFKLFLEANESQIESQDKNLADPFLGKIHLESILRADPEEESVIWRHLLTIGHLVNPSARTKGLLAKLSEEKTGMSALGDIISKIEKHVQDTDTSNPTEAIAKIMQSGFFTDIIAQLNDKVQKGELDINSLASSVGVNIPGGLPELGNK
jgi:hypothetical protein